MRDNLNDGLAALTALVIKKQIADLDLKLASRQSVANLIKSKNLTRNQGGKQ